MTLRFVATICAVALLSCAPTARIEKLPPTIDGLFKDYAGPDTPGASVSVIRNGKVLYSSVYGFANLEEQIPVTTATNFRLASVTKQFTAMAVMILADRGKLSLDSHLSDVLPGIPGYLRDVRLRHLLNHTSGIVDYESLIPDSQTVQVLDRDVLSLLQRIDSTYFSAGSQYRYSNSGYALLALVVETVSKQSFAQFLRANIFSPLGMNNTVAYEKGISSVANRAYGYSRSDTGFLCTDQSVTSAVLGDGGIYSSVEDLYKWDQALYTDKLIQASMLEQALAPGVLNDGTRTSYGFGWNIVEDQGVRSYFHSGSTRGFRNAILRHPQQGLTVIILTNRNEGNPIEIARKIADLVLHEQVL